MSIVYLNGDFVPLKEAKISVLDRGFTFGDGVYEMIPVFSGKVFRLPEHVKRLQTSLAAISLSLDYDNEKWHSLVNELSGLNNIKEDSSIYIQVTRGTGERNHLYQADFTPTVFIMFRPLPATNFAAGVSAVLHEDIRWKYCHIKAVTLLPNVLLKHYAKEKDGSHEAILSRDGYITEGAASNVFMVRDNTVMTPPKDGRLLPGITRDLIVELLRESDYECLEVQVTEAELSGADEVWITSATVGIAPIVKIDGKQVGSGKPGRVWRDVNGLYQAFKTLPGK